MIGVTGSSGYVGRALTKALREKGHEVATLGRGDASRYLDLTTTSGYRSVLEDLSTVIHCAGLAHSEALPAEYEQVNYKATMALADAALSAGVTRFIYLSSLNVVPVSGREENAVSSSLPKPNTAYACSKWMAEQSLEQLLRHSSCELSICRPGLVYDHELTGNLALLAKVAPRMPVALPPLGSRGMISRPDLVSLLVFLAEQETRLDRTASHFVVTDGECYSARRIALAFGCRAAVTAPAFLWRVGGLCRDISKRKSAGATWRSLSQGGWLGQMPAIHGWQPEWTLERLFAATVAEEVK